MSRGALLAALLAMAWCATPVVADPPACADGIDNDGDGSTDYPEDPDCESPNDPTEGSDPACADGIDNDGDGSTDYPGDPECSDPEDWSEEWPPACADGQDNDYDGNPDHPNDPDCLGPDDSNEAGPGTPSCSDGIDNDGDGPRDYPRDSDCKSPHDHSETTCDPVGCGGTTPCAGAPLPPMMVQTSRDEQGVHVFWNAPLTGTPSVYLVYRISIADLQRINLDSIVLDLMSPHDSVDGSQASYLDARASVAGAYVYWVTSTGPGCESIPSNAAPYMGGFLPDISDCATLDKDANPPPFSKPPSTVCLNGWP